jgi:hypothetical protein
MTEHTHETPDQFMYEGDEQWVVTASEHRVVSACATYADASDVQS